ncbi:serine hydrolase [Halorussus halophilus]|uniref:serine hydrolase n=1 Tax=Halorussus halophilus TaxID=2650975 RepID=UPI001301802F|nr:serine hydrolase [Halorussus halophilus]
MRPDGPRIETTAQLGEFVDSYREKLDGRLGVFLGFPDGPDDFDVVYRRAATTQFASASVVKLPVLYALLAKYDGRLSELDAPREIAPENRVAGSGVLHLLSATPTLRDLARAMISISDNAATNELVDELGMDRIESAAADVGMTDTRLRRKMMATLGDNDLELSGDWPDGEPANATTPLDCARFFADFHSEATLSAAAYDEMAVPLEAQKHAMKFPRYLPRDATVVHKTGELPEAALDTGYLRPPGGDGNPLVFAVLADELTTGADGADAIAEIGEAVYTWFNHRDP